MFLLQSLSSTFSRNFYSKAIINVFQLFIKQPSVLSTVRSVTVALVPPFYIYNTLSVLL